MKRVVAPLALACALTRAPGTWATQPSDAPSSGYSSYEAATLDGILEARNLELDPDPQGKTIESIDIVRLEVFDETDPSRTFSTSFTLRRERS